MFCEKCGKELFDECLICPNCGTNTRNFNAKEVKLNTPTTSNTFPKIDNEEAYNIVKKTESKIKKYGYLSFLELTPLLGIMLDMADDYFPFLFTSSHKFFLYLSSSIILSIASLTKALSS